MFAVNICNKSLTRFSLTSSIRVSYVNRETMADWEVVEERTISGKGVLQVAGSDTSNRAYALFCTVLRKPKTNSINLNYNPPRSRYGTLVFIREGYVIDTKPIEYEKQVWDGINDIAGQTLIAVKCAYEGTLQTFKNLAVALSATPGSIGLFVADTEDKIKDYENMRLAWDEVRVVCYSSTAVSIRLSKLDYDACDPSKVRDRPPPPPPPPKPPVPPDTHIENTPPYDEDTQDNSNSVPYPLDVPPPPPLDDPNDPIGWCIKGSQVFNPHDFRPGAAWSVVEPHITYQANSGDFGYWGAYYDTFSTGPSFVQGTYTIQQVKQSQCHL